MINGSERILYIAIEVDDEQPQNNLYIPIACLTSNSFDESLELLDTTTRLSGGWRTQRGVSQTFSVAFDGLQIFNDDSKASYEYLRNKKRTREVLDFKIENVDTTGSEVFKGQIEQLSETAVVNELLSFSGSIKGFGEPVYYPNGLNPTIPPVDFQNAWLLENGDVALLENNNVAIPENI